MNNMTLLRKNRISNHFDVYSRSDRAIVTDWKKTTIYVKTIHTKTSSNVSIKVHFMAKENIFREYKLASDRSTVEYARQPDTIICPHLNVRNFAALEP